MASFKSTSYLCVVAPCGSFLCVRSILYIYIYIYIYGWGETIQFSLGACLWLMIYSICLIFTYISVFSENKVLVHKNRLEH